MKNVIMISVLLLLVSSCKCGRKTNIDSDSASFTLSEPYTVVKVSSKKNSVFSLKIDDLSDEVRVPLSSLVESVEIVKLDNSEEALIGGNQGVSVYDNYILVKGYNQSPFKLFDKKGKFLNSIGAYGRGPNEYLNVYDYHLDEENEVIYILPWQSDKLLRYDLKGKPLPTITLVQQAPKGVFSVDTKAERVSVFVLPFSTAPLVAWVQDFDGNVISKIPTGPLALHPDYSNEVSNTRNTDNFDVFIFQFGGKLPDTLYHYSPKGVLQPKLALDFGSDETALHSLRELPNHYMGSIMDVKKLSKYTSTTTENLCFIVDKKTLKSSVFQLLNDYVSGEVIDYPIYKFTNGYFVNNYDPAILIEDIEKGLESKTVSEQHKNKMREILAGIKESDNNYIFYAKLKK